MTIYQGSRYEYSVVDFFAISPEGNENPVVFYNSAINTTYNYVEHTYTAGERLDLLSYEYYLRPDLAWYILDHNPEISDPQNIPSGTILRIPRA
jgi:hypothetical protein